MIFDKFLNKFTHEQKIFGLFLLINLIVWSVSGMIRLVLPTDTLEGIFWGSLHDFGTPKHPPLAGWITYAVYSIFKTDFSMYALCTIFILVGIFYIYKLAKFFLDDKSAILSAVVMEGCWAYTYVISYYGFNPDVVLLCLLPMLTYYAYKSMDKNKSSDWLKLGIITGLAFLNKYQTVLVLFPLILWGYLFRRKIFKNLFLYIAMIIAFFMFLPHLIWMVQHDFFPLRYFEGELTAPTFWHHISAPLFFLLMQIAAIAGVLLIYGLLKLRQKSGFKVNFTLDEKSWFLILVGFTPLLVHLLMGFITGGTMRPRWGYEFLFFTGIMLFYFIPVKEISEKDFNFVFKLAYIAMFLVAVSMTTLLGVEKNYRSRYPVSTIYNDLNSIWNAKFDTPLKYVGGYIEWTLPLTIYAPAHPICILDTNGYENPWIDEEDLKKYGVLIIDRKISELEEHLFKSCPYLDQDYPVEPVEYRFKVKNALNMEREYTVYYLIIPPSKISGV